MGFKDDRRSDYQPKNYGEEIIKYPPIERINYPSTSYQKTDAIQEIKNLINVGFTEKQALQIVNCIVNLK